MKAESEQLEPSTDLRLGGLAMWLLVCSAAAALGAFFPPDDWYKVLQKPSWAPPNWLFGPVWTTLYAMMAVAAWLVWRLPQNEQRRQALDCFLVQLAINAAWSCLFFGMHRIDLALADILLMLAAIATTSILFYRLHRTAGLLLLPYLAWVTFAAALNFAFWRLNS